jgi:ankyrin repeat protein
VKVQLDAKVDVNAQDDYRWTALHRAASSGHADVVLDVKADINASRAHEKTIFADPC